MGCLVLRISIFHQLNERGKSIVLTPIICCGFRCGQCLGYEPAGTLFDLEKTYAIDIQSSHAGRVIPLLVSLPKKKGHYQ